MTLIINVYAIQLCQYRESECIFHFAALRCGPKRVLLSSFRTLNMEVDAKALFRSKLAAKGGSAADKLKQLKAKKRQVSCFKNI